MDRALNSRIDGSSVNAKILLLDMKSEYSPYRKCDFIVVLNLLFECMYLWMFFFQCAQLDVHSIQFFWLAQLKAQDLCIFSSSLYMNVHFIYK